MTHSLIHHKGKKHMLKKRDIWSWRLDRTRLSETKKQQLTAHAALIYHAHYKNNCETRTEANNSIEPFLLLSGNVSINANLAITLAQFWIFLPCGKNVPFSLVNGWVPVWSNKTLREKSSKRLLMVSGSSIVGDFLRQTQTLGQAKTHRLFLTERCVVSLDTREISRPIQISHEKK